jgi:hypothetical protein
MELKNHTIFESFPIQNNHRNHAINHANQTGTQTSVNIDFIFSFHSVSLLFFSFISAFIFSTASIHSNLVNSILKSSNQFTVSFFNASSQVPKENIPSINHVSFFESSSIQETISNLISWYFENNSQSFLQLSNFLIIELYFASTTSR